MSSMKQNKLCNKDLKKVNGGTGSLPQEIIIEHIEKSDLHYDAKNEQGGNEDIWVKK